MAEDSQETPSGTTPADGASDSSNTTPDVDTDALREALEQAKTDAGTQAELANLRRAAGHIPGITSRLDKLEKSVQSAATTASEVRALATRFDTLLNSLPDGLVSERVVAGLRPTAGDSSADLLARFAELEERLTTPQTNEPADLSPAQAQEIAQWDIATSAVESYAKRHEVDSSAIAQSVWADAMTKHRNNPADAAVEVMKHIDTLVATKGRQAERADAAKGGTESARTSRSGPVTIEQLKRMSVAEVQALPQEVVMAAMAAGA